MPIVDLTAPMTSDSRREELRISHGDSYYTGLIYHFAHDSMAGTYIDLPGHIKETDDGRDAENYPVAKLFRVESLVVHLDRKEGSGGVTADELNSACDGKKKYGCVVINARGRRQYYEVDERSVWLTRDAVDWIIATGAHLLVSDIFECHNLIGVFYYLFKARISTVCHPVNLHQIAGKRAKITVLMPRMKGVTQLPCRVLAECG